jgi:predicted dehydrogenase
MMKRLRVGIIGLGVGERHIGGFRRHPAADVVALCDINADVRARVHQSYPDMALLDDADALIDDDRIDVVSIASYDDVHFSQVQRALNRGKHVFVEKPLCLRIEEFQTIKKLLADNPHLHLSSNLVLRASPRFKYLREMIQSGTLGRVFNIEGDYLYGRLEKLTAGWRGRIPHYSVVLGGAIHLLDLILWLTGDRVAEVVAVGNGTASAGSTFHGLDMASALLRFESGLIGTISANYGCVYPHYHRLVVYGTKATFENGREAGLLWRSRDPSVTPETITKAYPGVDKGDLIPSFVDAILGNGVAAVTEQEVLSAMAVGLAIERSLSERRMVKIAEV